MIIGKSLTALGGGGLKPEIRVTAKAGALLNLRYKDSSIILNSYQLGAEETQHTFVVSVSETAYVVEDVTNGKSVEVLVDAVAQYSVEIKYTPGNALYWLGDECEDITGGWVVGSREADYPSDIILTKYEKYITASSTTRPAYLGTVNTINTTGYTKLKALIDYTFGDISSHNFEFKFSIHSGNGYNPDKTMLITTKTNCTYENQEVELDISGLTDRNVYFAWNSASRVGTRIVNVHKVWLE